MPRIRINRINIQQMKCGRRCSFLTWAVSWRHISYKSMSLSQQDMVVSWVSEFGWKLRPNEIFVSKLLCIRRARDAAHQLELSRYMKVSTILRPPGTRLGYMPGRSILTGPWNLNWVFSQHSLMHIHDQGNTKAPCGLHIQDRDGYFFLLRNAMWLWVRVCGPQQPGKMGVATVGILPWQE